ncbi:MAG: Uma2 family endonuclease [Candidatus Poribacteria bacterium]|nr:Uma2 family endonuclease [Candidatus Poribacteria bacterium]
MIVEKMGEERGQEVQAQPTVDVENTKKPTPPPLKHGARLTQKEFERRYDAMPDLKKAELIEGVVYMPSPARMDIHSRPHAYIITWLGTYCAATPGTDFGDNATVRLASDGDEPQPDALLRIDVTPGGNSRISDDGYVEGTPELIVEISGTSADYDLHDKLEVYRRNGVMEYIVWQTEDRRLDWFRLVEEQYVPRVPDANCTIESQAFPGLRLAVRALLEGNLGMVLFELQKGLKTDGHAAFVEQLSNMIATVG